VKTSNAGLRFRPVQPILSFMTATLKAIVAAAVLGTLLGMQTPLWSIGLKTHFTFDAAEGTEGMESSAPDSGAKWISKRKVSALWGPRAAAWSRMAGGTAAIVLAYALTVFAVLRSFGLVRRGVALAVIGAGAAVSTLIDARLARSGSAPPVILGAPLAAAAVLGMGIGLRFARKKRQASL
jgi:hypothetical protein